MVDDVFVEARLAEGQRLVQGMVRGGVAVVVAGWVVGPGDRWQLYISGDYPEPNGWGDAFRVLHGCYMGFEPSTVGLSDIRLVRATDAVTGELLSVRDRGRPGRVARARVDHIDDRPARRVYVYPSHGEMNPQEVIRAVAELISRNGTAPPSEVELSGGRKLTAVPVGIEQDYATGRVSVKLFDPATRQAETYPLAEITGIH